MSNKLKDKFSFTNLNKACTMKDDQFFTPPFSDGGQVFTVQGMRHLFIDNGAKVLAIAHVDTVLGPARIGMIEEVSPTIGVSAAFDDRLGVYTIIDFLPEILGENAFDILLTEGEESGMSTASDFTVPEGKEYNWIFQFDRRGTTVVMYQYHNDELEKLLESYSFKVAFGSFSDIGSLEHLGVKGFNFGVGYHDEHNYHCYVIWDEYFSMVGKFVNFYQHMKNTKLIHTPEPKRNSTTRGHYNYYDSYDDWKYRNGKWQTTSIEPYHKGNGQGVKVILNGVAAWFNMDDNVYEIECAMCREYVDEASIDYDTLICKSCKDFLPNLSKICDLCSELIPGTEFNFKRRCCNKCATKIDEHPPEVKCWSCLKYFPAEEIYSQTAVCPTCHKQMFSDLDEPEKTQCDECGNKYSANLIDQENGKCINCSLNDLEDYEENESMHCKGCNTRMFSPTYYEKSGGLCPLCYKFGGL